MNEIFSRINASGRQAVAAVAFVVVASVTQMAIPSMLDKGDGRGGIAASIASAAAPAAEKPAPRL